MTENELLKRHRRTPLARPDAMPVRIDYGREDIVKIVPHRDPFLLLDGLTALDFDQRILAGYYQPSSDLPLFRGHFPDYPIYPGSLQVEAIGQLGLAMVHFIGRGVDSIGADAQPPAVRATRICGAYYRSEVRPDDRMVLLAQVRDFDAYFGVILGQTVVGKQVATAAMLEVAFL